MADDVRRTDSGIEIKPVYTADDLAGWDPDAQLGRPGQAPYTRGIYPSMYRGRLWTMRQYSGFGTAEATNERFKFLLGAGQTGLSCAFDLPTQMGYDSDHPRAEGEVGKVGVAIDSLDDMRLLLDGIPLDKVTTSMTINSTAADPAAALRAGRRGAGRRQRRASAARSRTTCSRSTSPAAPTSTRPGRRCGSSPTSSPTAASASPAWNTISISGYHIREAGLDGGAGDRLHARQRHRLRAGGDRRRPRRRRVRAPAVVLLERPQQLLRRGRQVPGRRGACGTGS